MVTNPCLHDYVQDRLAAQLPHEDVIIVPDPTTPVWKASINRIEKIANGLLRGAQSKFLIACAPISLMMRVC